MDISCYSKDELLKQYSPSAWTRRMSPDQVIQEHVNICAAASDEARSKSTCTLDVQYGSSPGQRMDILRGDQTHDDAPIFVFFHGGYWMACCKEDYCFISTPIIESGCIFISVEYDLAPSVTLTEIVKEAGNALRYIINMAQQNKSKSIYLCGHSAGAQLCVLSLCSQDVDLTPEERQLIKGLILISGVYDITPLVQTSENDVLKMTREEAWRCSPMNSEVIHNLTSQYSHSDVIVAVGEYDSPQFKLQSQKYHMLLGDCGVRSNLQRVPGVDHFEIVENFRLQDDILLKAILELIGKNSAAEKNSALDEVQKTC